MVSTGMTTMITTRTWNLKSVIFTICVTVSGTAYAQQRPLVTEDPETIGGGRVLLEGGVSFDNDVTHPTNGITGDLARLASFGVSVGVGPAAEVQIDGGLLQRVTVTEVSRINAIFPRTTLVVGDRATGLEDLVVATKIRLASESDSSPAVGLRFGTKLPLASPEDGVGLGTTDFFASFLIAKTVQSVRTVGNVGLAILGNPVTPQDTATALGYGVSIARALTDEFELVGELNGRLTPFEDLVPAGTESRAVLRFAGRYTYALLRLDFGILVGLTDRDPTFGISAGATYVITR
jgi:hypothetical protein